MFEIDLRKRGDVGERHFRWRLRARWWWRLWQLARAVRAARARCWSWRLRWCRLLRKDQIRRYAGKHD